jgi:hypothetical protein
LPHTQKACGLSVDCRPEPEGIRSTNRTLKTPTIATTNPKARDDPGKYRRCSRPLCSSQHTIGTSPPRPTGRLGTGPTEGAETPPHHHAERGKREAWSLRTQQRARPATHAQTRSNRQAGVLGSPRSSRTHCQCSTHELPARTVVSIRRLDTTPNPDGPASDASCSLERR